MLAEGSRPIHAEIAQRTDEIAAIGRHYRASRLELFGSAARSTDFDRETSDADILVDFEPPLLPGIARRYTGLADDLQALPGREVDLVRSGTVENEYLQAAIDRSRELVFAA